MSKRQYFLNDDCKIVYNQSPKHRVLMLAPESLMKMSAEDIWRRVITGFRKYEVEYWVAEEIIAIGMQAVAEGKKYADFSAISQVEVWDNENPENFREMGSDEFFRRFCNLRIFKIVEESEDEIILEFVPEMS